MDSSARDIIVLSHLRWNWVTQRPQHIMNRMAEDRNIYFIEEPDENLDIAEGEAKVERISDKITIITPKFKWEAWSLLAPKYVPLIKKTIEENNLNDPIFWFYTPVYVPVLEEFTPSTVVYDCMDELSAFKFSLTELPQLEKQLLEKANIVFTGGKSLYESKKKHHNNVYCFPSSVDEAHFLKALAPETEIPDDLNKIKKPVVGYYGVIDERIDLPLIAAVARALPDASFVMIGPTAKIEEKDLPQAANIHYLGKKEYDDLPGYLKGFDIAMMPFALNEATEFISPTKTLEFMAALKPIVSTGIYDVTRDYSHVVRIAKDAADFAKGIAEYLEEDLTAKDKREEAEKEVIRNTSWDKTVAEMKKIMDEKNE